MRSYFEHSGVPIETFEAEKAAIEKFLLDGQFDYSIVIEKRGGRDRER